MAHSPSHDTDLVFGLLTKQGGVKGLSEWGSECVFWCVFSPNYNKTRMPDILEEVEEEARVYFRDGLSFSTYGLDRQKDSGTVLPGRVKRSVLFSLLPFLCWQLSRNRENRALLVSENWRRKKIQKTHIVCMVIHMGIWFVFCMYRVGKRIWVRHELHSQCGHQRASGRCGRSQASGDERLPSEG